ncbi:MAG: YdeI/OmpD-associated family protein [Bacteroidia bacterium]|nr:YdeI/OmpD-associated family protein [Bacteroidia bacterium]
MGNGQLFLPVRAEIRKKIGKKAGDWVNVILFSDNGPAEIPEEFMVCLLEDPVAHKTFISLSDGQQKKLIDWIYSAKTDDTKVERMAETLNRLVTGKFFGDK